MQDPLHLAAGISAAASSIPPANDDTPRMPPHRALPLWGIATSLLWVAVYCAGWAVWQIGRQVAGWVS
jgi:hypothetical protein